MAEVSLNLGEWERSISKTISHLTDKESLLEKSFNILGISDIQNHFRDEMGNDGNWAPWSAAYAKRRLGTISNSRRVRKEAKYIGVSRLSVAAMYAKKLQFSGFLRKSLLNPEKKMINQTTLRIQAPPGYGGFLDEGTKKMPARPFMWLSDDAQGGMIKAILEWIAVDIT